MPAGSSATFPNGQLPGLPRGEIFCRMEISLTGGKIFTAPAIGSAADTSNMICISKERFDDATSNFAYRGYNYSIGMDGIVFKVRNYDDMPGWFTVISPTLAIKLPEARHLVDYLRLQFGCREVDFYDAVTNTYRSVDLQTLEFQTFEF
jgi:hypothetical protein